jgi:lipid-A-disaccharide synthase
VRAEKESVPVKKLSDKPVIALLPGSRKQEISIKLPVMLQIVKHFPQYQFVVAGAPSQPDSLYQDLIGSENVMLVRNETYNILKQSSAALVTSGTATLETALFGVPQVVCYKGNPISYWLATKLIKVKYISLVNLIMDKPVVTELIQNELNEQRLKEELSLLLTESERKQELLKDYNTLWHKLGDSPASERAAEEIISLARK